MTILKRVLVVVGTIALAIVVTAVIGLLSIRADLLEGGLVLDWRGAPAATTTPTSPWQLNVGVGVVSLIAIVAVWPWGSRRRSSFAVLLPALVLGVVLLASIVWAYATTDFPFDAASIFGSPSSLSFAQTAAPTESRPETWLRAGALSQASLVLVAFAVAVVALSGVGRRRDRH